MATILTPVRADWVDRAPATYVSLWTLAASGVRYQLPHPGDDGTITQIRIFGSGTFVLRLYQDEFAINDQVDNILRVDGIFNFFQVVTVPIVYSNPGDASLYTEVTGGTGPFALELTVVFNATRG